LVSGKLGRPMPIRKEDFEVNLPLAVDDDLLTETSIDTNNTANCNIWVAIEGMKFEVIEMDMYRAMYAVKRDPKEYTQLVESFENRIKAWRDQWPAIFRDPPATPTESNFRIWGSGGRLLLHHPSLSLSNSAQFNKANLRSCLDAAKELLSGVVDLQRCNSLDNTWYNCATYILVIQTILYCHGQLKDQLTPEILEDLQSDMDKWQSIMVDIGRLLGKVFAPPTKTLGLIGKLSVSDICYRFGQQTSRWCEKPNR
jgi:hypothetical protein